MASHPAYASPPLETDSGAFFKVAALLLGLTVAILGFFALMLWADARDARDQAGAAAPRPKAAHPTTTTRRCRSRASRASFRTNADALAEAHKANDATLPPLPAGDLVKVHMTLKDMTVQIAPGVKYRPGRSTATARPGPIVHVREGQTVEMTLTNGGAIPHSIDFHAARIAPNVAFSDVAPGDSFTFRFKANDPGVYMYHCGTKPVLAHIANGMYGAIVVEPKRGAAAGRQRVRARRERVVHERRRHRGACVARHGQGARDGSRTGRRSTATPTST